MAQPEPREPRDLLQQVVAGRLGRRVSGLRERPRHPDELAATMRQRARSSVAKLTTGTLYAVLEALHRDGWIAPVGPQRHGDYPERTVYATTDAGHTALLDWLRAVLRAPRHAVDRAGNDAPAGAGAGHRQCSERAARGQ